MPKTSQWHTSKISNPLDSTVYSWTKFESWPKIMGNEDKASNNYNTTIIKWDRHKCRQWFLLSVNPAINIGTKTVSYIRWMLHTRPRTVGVLHDSPPNLDVTHETVNRGCSTRFSTDPGATRARLSPYNRKQAPTSIGGTCCSACPHFVTSQGKSRQLARQNSAINCLVWNPHEPVESEEFHKYQ